jgi:V-type H+-transporting ATPase subunit a
MYRLYFKKERLIYSNLNKCQIEGSFLVGEVWIPAERYPLIEATIRRVSNIDDNRLATQFTDQIGSGVPPTYFKLNDLTAPFQLIVNTYGIPRYREANPALFAIVSFPFLFGVMFGDIGHGLLLFLFGLYLVMNNNNLSPSLRLFGRARYLFLFMGFFAFYAGWMYNDFLSIPLNVFGSCYDKVLLNLKFSKDIGLRNVFIHLVWILNGTWRLMSLHSSTH